MKLYNADPRFSTQPYDEAYDEETALNLLKNSSDPKERELWQKTNELYKERLEKGMNEEMKVSLGTMKMIMDLKTAYPSVFHYLKGNHDDIMGGFIKYANESEQVRSWMRSNFNEDFLEKWAEFEKNLPLLARGKNFVASHTCPGEEYSEEQIRLKGQNTVRDMTWSDNTDWLPKMNMNFIVDANLTNLKRDPNKTVWVIGHRPVGGDGRYWQQYPNLVQMNNQTELVYAYIPNDKKFDPDKEVYKI